MRTFHGYERVESPSAMLASDLHCSGGCGELNVVLMLAADLGIRDVFILGDLWDNMHFGTSTPELRRAFSVIVSPRLRGLDMRIWYVASGSSHDPIVGETCYFSLDGVSVAVFPRPIFARIGRLDTFLTHGDIAVPNGAVAYAINRVGMALGRRLLLESYLKRRLRLPRDTWLIMGHTHIAGVDYRRRVANTGSWRASWIGGFRYWRRPAYTFIVIRGDKLFLGELRGLPHEGRML